VEGSPILLFHEETIQIEAVQSDVNSKEYKEHKAKFHYNSFYVSLNHKIILVLIENTVNIYVLQSMKQIHHIFNYSDSIY